jgi:hypothetical protein
MNLFGLEAHVSPFQREQLAPPQAVGDGQQDQGSFSKAQICEQSLDFIAGQDIWCRSAFCALPNPLNGVAVAEVVAETVIEQQSHYIPHLAACSWRSVQTLQPRFDFHSPNFEQPTVDRGIFLAG